MIEAENEQLLGLAPRRHYEAFRMQGIVTQFESDDTC